MPTNLTTEQIAEWERVCESVPPPPWAHGDGCCGPYICNFPNADERLGPEPLSDYDGSEPLWLGGSVDESVREFVVKARTAMPALIKEVERLRAEAHKYRDALWLSLDGDPELIDADILCEWNAEDE